MKNKIYVQYAIFLTTKMI